MNNLEILIENKGDEVLLKCIGRLDANRAGHLNDYVNKLVREGHYHILVDLTGIEYLSSAGIRSLIIQNRNLKTVNGYFYIVAMSETVQTVLEMAGIAEMLCNKPELEKPLEKSESKKEQLEVNGFRYNVSGLSASGKKELSLYGNPELVLQSAYSEEHARVVRSESNHFALGLGAIGDSFSDCSNRFGEYMILGKNIAYLPGDGSKSPDYMSGSGSLVASLTELYGLHFTGNFTHLIRFDPIEPKSTIGLSQLMDSLYTLTKSKKMAVVILAESGGLIGTSLNASPVEGRKIFSFPEVKDTVNFTTEPAHVKALTLSVGYVSKDGDGETAKFLRPLKPGSPAAGHFHSAVFPYIPLKKSNIDLNETIEDLFNNSELNDILHLTNDSREISGLGESQFIHGFCFVVSIESTELISTKTN